MKLYTRKGDDGSTGLFGGQRVSKDSLRVQAYGTVDELNSFVGSAAAACGDEPLKNMLVSISSRLFDIGADLATPHDTDNAPASSRVGAGHVAELEEWIDQISANLPAMRHFILPGGCEAAARLHIARTVCRRAERLCVHLSGEVAVAEAIVIYLNRLSDLLFAMARRANQLAGVEDTPWVSDPDPGSV